jgi:hypothetical protein
MVVHAAGESAAVYEHAEAWRQEGATFGGATAVVLEANDELHLQRIREHLEDQEIDYVPIHESGGVYHGQFMAIGIVPGSREDLAGKLVHFQTLKTCGLPPDLGDVMQAYGVRIK